MGADGIPKPFEVNPNKVASFDLDKHIREYQKEYDAPRPPRVADTPETEMMRPSDHKQSILDALKDIYETTACYSCPFILKCDCRVWNKGIEFAKVTGCAGHPDQTKYKGRSTTVTITDTSLSGWNNSGFQTTWALARDHTGQTHLHDQIMHQVNYTPGLGYYIARGMLLFDSSSIPLDSIVYSAKYYLYGLIKSGTHSVVALDGQPTYPHNPIVDADFDRTNITSLTYYYAWISSPGMTLSAYTNYWVIDNSTLKLYDYIKSYSLQYDNDALNSNPGGTYNIYMQFEGPTHAGGHDPKFTIIYEPPPPPIASKGNRGLYTGNGFGSRMLVRQVFP